MKKIRLFPNYQIDDMGRIYNKDMRLLTPYYSERDNVMYINLYRDGGRYLRVISVLMQQAFFSADRQKDMGVTLIPQNADFRNVCLHNLVPVPTGKAVKLKRIMLAEDRYQNFYESFMANPSEYEFHKLPIDVQHYLNERVEIPWDLKTLGYPM